LSIDEILGRFIYGGHAGSNYYLFRLGSSGNSPRGWKRDLNTSRMIKTMRIN
jgi:hypothetical protein